MLYPTFIRSSSSIHVHYVVIQAHAQLLYFNKTYPVIKVNNDGLRLYLIHCIVEAYRYHYETSFLE